MPDPKLDHADDQHLVELCNHGGAAEAADAFEALYRRHRDYVLRLALRFTGDRELALDVMQETFGYLLRKFPPEGSPAGFELTAKLTTFLYPVVKHNAFTARRKARRFTQPGEDAPEPAGDSPGDEHADDLAVVLAGLSEERREVLMLRFVDGLSLEEIAAAMSIPVGTVKSRIHLAIKQLRDDPRIQKFFEV